jgi:hypothetical protein
VVEPRASGKPEIRYYEISDACPFCQKVVAAVSELREVHGDAVDFVIVPPEETAQRGAEIERYLLSARRHGLARKIHEE